MEENNPNEEVINKQFKQQFESADKINLPNAIVILILGIVSTIFALSWLYWVGSFIGLTCGIIALVMSKRAKAVYKSSPGVYKPVSLSNIKAGKVLSILGICLASLALIVLMIGLYFMITNPRALVV